MGYREALKARSQARQEKMEEEVSKEVEEKNEEHRNRARELMNERAEERRSSATASAKRRGREYQAKAQQEKKERVEKATKKRGQALQKKIEQNIKTMEEQQKRKTKNLVNIAGGIALGNPKLAWKGVKGATSGRPDDPRDWISESEKAMLPDQTLKPGQLYTGQQADKVRQKLQNEKEKSLRPKGIRQTSNDDIKNTRDNNKDNEEGYTSWFDDFDFDFDLLDWGHGS